METLVASQMDLSEAIESIRFHTSLREPITGFDEEELKRLRLKMLGALLVSAMCAHDDSYANMLVTDEYKNLQKFYRNSHPGARFSPDFLAKDDYSSIKDYVASVMPGSWIAQAHSR